MKMKYTHTQKKIGEVFLQIPRHITVLTCPSDSGWNYIFASNNNAFYNCNSMIKK